MHLVVAGELSPGKQRLAIEFYGNPSIGRGVFIVDSMHAKENIVMKYMRSLLFLLMGILLIACTITRTADLTAPAIKPIVPSTDTTSANACPLTEPTWAKFPEDSAIQDPPAYGNYFINEDSSIWASAWWVEQEENYLHAGEDIKVGWFRPARATLEITSQRLDGKANALETHIPCCYPTRFQASGLLFPTSGCWEVTARAEDRKLSFVVWVEP
ncbi:MAG: hypothetical protein ABIU06_09300 [Anaerolineales bacterium]